MYRSQPDTTEFEYNILGKPIIGKPPKDAANPLDNTFYIYNSMGQIIQKNTPDNGAIKNIYNSAGQLRFLQDANQAYMWDNGLGKPVFVYNYDKLGRITTVAILNHPDIAESFEAIDGNMSIDQYIDPDHYFIKIRNIYDELDGNEEYLDNSPLEYLEPSDLLNTRGRIVAVICYGEKFTESGNPTCKVIDAYSSDDEGRLKVRYKSIPGLPLQTTTYFYGLQGELYKKEYNNGETIITTKYNYDNNGRLLNVADKDDGPIVLYDYTEYNMQNLKTFIGRPGGSTLYHPLHLKYNIRDWLTSIEYNNAGSLFRETMFYGEPADDPLNYPDSKRRYDGTIGRAKIDQSTPQFSSLDMLYTYDQPGRLLEVNSQAGDPNNYFGASYTYDIGGRIQTKNEANIAMGEYKYENNKNRLKYIKDSNKDKTAGGYDNYIYDAKGNMALDRSKKMAVVYDWRNMPVSFKFYDNIPDEEILWINATELEKRPDVKLVSFVEMMYDATGNRVSKKVVKEEK